MPNKINIIDLMRDFNQPSLITGRNDNAFLRVHGDNCYDTLASAKAQEVSHIEFVRIIRRHPNYVELIQNLDLGLGATNETRERPMYLFTDKIVPYLNKELAKARGRIK
jgi:hypothetical protein